MAKRFFLIVVLLGILSGYPLLQKGLHPTHDGEYHVIRFYEFDKMLRDGNIYPRWAPDLNNGYGVPLFNYVYPFPNYVASFLHTFGISFIDAFKLNMFFATIIGLTTMYLWAKSFWGKTGAIVSSVFYTFAPYHFVDIYVRGAVGEVWALAFFPAFLWSATVLIKERRSRFVVLSGIFLALIIFSHNILALMFLPFALSYVLLLILLSKEKLYAIRYTLYAIFLGLGLSAIFWVPAIFERDLVTGLQIYSVEKNFPEIYQLLIPSWGSGFSEGSISGQMSYQIGIANLIAVMFSIIAAIIFFKKCKKDNTFTIVFFLLCFTLVFFLMLPLSLPIWKTIPLLNYFQFPWRLLSLIIVFCSFLAGSIVFAWKSKKVYFIFVLLPVVFGIGYTKPAYYHQRNDLYYISRSNFIDGTNSPGNTFNTLWMDRGLQKKKSKLILRKEEGKILGESIKNTKYIFTVFLYRQADLSINTAYFPGWEVFVDGSKVKVTITKEGLISFILPQGRHEITVIFVDTSIRVIAKMVSIISFIILLVFLLGRRNDTI